MNRLKKKIEAK